MERKLASIQRVESLEAIEGADRIVKARVMGWDVVVKRDEFQPGDRCVFFEIDSLLPEGREWAEFMRPRGFRVKTAKLRGVLSQGLALPLSVLSAERQDLAVGVEVSAELGVTKYEPVLPAGGAVAGPFPGAVPKTDEIRLQSALGVLQEIAGLDFYISVKCDGTSATFFKSEGALTVCSRNWALEKGPSAQWQLAERHQLLERLDDGIALQAEICGPGIQKNRLGLSQVEMFVFSVYDAKRGHFLPVETSTKRPITGGVAMPCPFQPQHASSPVSRMAQLCMSPALTLVNTPAGGVSIPEHSKLPSRRMPHSEKEPPSIAR